MKLIIKSIKKTYNLYKQPLQIGDLLEFKQTKMNGHDLNDIEKGILAKVEAALYPQAEVAE